MKKSVKEEINKLLIHFKSVYHKSIFQKLITNTKECYHFSILKLFLF